MMRFLPKLAVFSVLALALVNGCAERPGPGQRTRRPSILLITIDALRADHVGWAGHLRPTTPFLDSLRSEATAYSDASSVSSWTVPALASLMTGLYPPSHGVVHGTGFDPARQIADQEMLPESLPLLPEKLGELGYETFAVVANLHGHGDFGYARGFDHFRCVGFNPASSVEETLASWRRELTATNRPVFLWIHYFDPHWPYHHREPWTGRFVAGDPAEALSSVAEISRTWPALPAAVGMSLDARMESARELYDVEIAYADHMIEEAYRALPMLAGWFTVVTSDHGEEFFDHGQLEHSWNLYAETVQIPMIVKSHAESGPRTITAPVGLIDVPPTLLRVAGGSPPGSWAGESLVDGAGRVRTDLPPDRKMLSFLDRSETRRHRVALIGPRWKLITGADRDRCWLFDLANDPLERQDVAVMEPELTAALRAELEARLAELPPKPAVLPTVALSAQQLKELEAIGYVDGE